MKKKKIMIATLSVLLIGGLAAVGIYLGISHLGDAGDESVNLSGVEWYDEEKDKFTISTAEELYELAKISEYYDMKGQTIKLDADIVVNEGNAEDWVEKAPEKMWTPILNFAGTFDGQGHTISGLYGIGYLDSMGMFVGTQRSSKIQNFKLVNSYFESNSAKGTGSVIGSGGGSLDTVYSNAIVKAIDWNTGGLVGVFTESGTNKINNCWYDGKMVLESDYGRYAGGILGTVKTLGGRNQIEHCLNSGTIYTAAPSNPCVGGICGAVNDNGSLIMTDNLNVGAISTIKDVYGVGSVLGRVIGKSTTVSITKTYGTSDSYKQVLGGSEGKMTGKSTMMRAVDLNGYGGYQWTNLDFEKYWAVVENSTPILQSFADKIISLDGIAKKIDTSWYKEGGKEFVITTAAQLFGLAELSRTVDFKGVTIKLGADISCNDGKASQWGEKEPINLWRPIGYTVEYGGKAFQGIFDGQMHTISGLYGKSTRSCMGLFGEIGTQSVVKNLKIVNSYFETSIAKKSSWGMIGSVAGKCSGTVDTVYSNAILVNSGATTGGMVGMIRDDKAEGNPKIINCWFDGKIHANGNSGGMVGELYGCKGTIEHCLYSGEIAIMSKAGNYGGFCGVVGSKIKNNEPHLYLSDCVNTGKITGTKGCWNIGAAVGKITTASKGTINNVYIAKETSGAIMGNSSDPYTGTGGLRISTADMTGANAYRNTLLNFQTGRTRGYWVAQADKTPQLKSFAKGRTLALGGMRADISWYNKDKDTYTISNLNQLWGFRQLTETKNFKGKTIKLANDIVVNQGDANTWGATAPAIVWRPLGYSVEFGGTAFQGTFDGQGHTVSGLYAKTEKSVSGFFGEIGTSAVVKNLKVTNSYFEAVRAKSDNWGMVGGVAGKCAGTVDTVYCNATLVNNGTVTGGIVGMMRDDKKQGTCKVTNCWYDGKIVANGSTGGIIGDIYGCKATIEHCLNTGSITVIKSSGNVGGLCGLTEIKSKTNQGYLVMTDSLNAGMIDTTNGPKSWNIGAALGRATGDTKADINNVYVVQGTAAKGIGADDKVISGTGVTMLTRQELSGEYGYMHSNLDYFVSAKNENGKWAAIAGQLPVLRSFASGNLMDLTYALRPDTSWYDKNREEFVITTVAQLYGMTTLSKTEDFAGKTIKLGADITINNGNAADWGTNAPNYSWTPIGYSGINTGHKKFAGTFDGQMHTISGIYIDKKADRLGLFGETAETCMIRNLILKNSYIKTTSAYYSLGCTGAVVGRLSGTVDTVKCAEDVYVVGTSKGLGGVVGDVIKGTLNNVLFAGNVKMALGSSTKANELKTERHYGGMIGTVYASGSDCVMTNCLVTGKIDFGAYVGGLCGSVRNGCTLEIRDSMYAGAFQEVGSTNKNCRGTIVGQKQGSASLKAENVYAGKEATAANLVGNNAAATNGMATLDRAGQLTGQEAYLNTKLNFYVPGMNETGAWVIQEGKMPSLKSFTTGETIDLTQVFRVEPDTKWYDEHKEEDEYIISTAGELLGLSELSKTNDFAGKTIKLGADIVLNNGNAADWASQAPTYSWTPIGCSGINAGHKKFAGTFDGQMHIISGIYINKGAVRLGLFGETAETCIIRNLILKNSYIKTTAAYYSLGSTGAVVGRLSGTVDTVKCAEDVYVVGTTKGLGGVAGDVIKGTLNNVLFAGNVKMALGSSTKKNELKTERDYGGITGAVYVEGSTCVMTNCLVTGKVDFGSYTGGLCGRVSKDCTLEIRDTMYAGTFQEVGSTSKLYRGRIVGQATGTVTASQVFAVEDALTTSLLGAKGNNTEDGMTSVTATDVSGIEAYNKMGFDFYVAGTHEDGYWLARTDKMPILARFAEDADKEAAVDITKTQETRTLWFDGKKDTYTLCSPADLRGFQTLSKENSFKGITIKLGADIDLNPGWEASKAETQETITPKAWSPIGLSDANGSTAYQKFAGTFDGNMCSISGVYISRNASKLALFGETGEGCVIKNLELKNSFIKSSKPYYNTGYTAAVVAVLNGKVDTVKCAEDVYVRSQARAAGGLVGGVLAGTTGTVNNCWFAGHIGMVLAGSKANELKTDRDFGGLVGSMYSGDGKCTISNSLFTGTLPKAGTVGGLLGSARGTSTAKIKNALFAGSFVDVEATVTSNCGRVIGRVASTVAPNIEGTYAVSDPNKLVTYLIGDKGNAAIEGVTNVTEITGDAGKLMQTITSVWKKEETDETKQ